MKKYINRNGIGLIISACILAGAIIYHGQIRRYQLYSHKSEHIRMFDTITGDTYEKGVKNSNGINQWEKEISL